MNNQIVQWLLSEAGAGWVFGTISLIALIGSYVYNKNKSSIIIFNELRKASLIHLSPKTKERVNITFDNNSVDSMGYIDAELYNNGVAVIKEPILTFSVPENARILNIEARTALDNFEVSTKIEGNKASLKLPYLNPVKDHNHVLQLSILLDGSINSLDITGSGEGWSTRHFRTLESKKLLPRELAGLAMMGLVIILADIYAEYFVRRRLGLDPYSFDFQVLLLFLPSVFIMLLIFYWMYAPRIKSRPRSKDVFNRASQPTQRAADGGDSARPQGVSMPKRRPATKSNSRSPRRR